MNFNEWINEWIQENKSKSTFMEDYDKEYDRRFEALLKAKWSLGFKDRGMGHGDFAVVTKALKRDILIVECPNRAIAEHIIEAHNGTIKSR